VMVAPFVFSMFDVIVKLFDEFVCAKQLAVMRMPPVNNKPINER